MKKALWIFSLGFACSSGLAGQKVSVTNNTGYELKIYQCKAYSGGGERGYSSEKCEWGQYLSYIKKISNGANYTVDLKDKYVFQGIISGYDNSLSLEQIYGNGNYFESCAEIINGSVKSGNPIKFQGNSDYDKTICGVGTTVTFNIESNKATLDVYGVGSLVYWP